MNGWFTFSKICLFALNFIFLIIGLLMIAIGIWNIVESASFFEAIAFFGKTPTTVPALFADTEAMRIFAWILVVVGGLAFVISFLACWGVASENKWILITYAAVVSFLVLVEVLFVILLFGLEHQWGPKLTQEITDTFSTNYVGSMGAFEPTKYDPFSLAMDAYMLKYDCCGTRGPQTFLNKSFSSAWQAKGRTFVGKDRTYKDDEVVLPTACCQFRSITFFKNQRYAEYLNFMVDPKCPVETMTSFNNQSCLEVVAVEIEKHKLPLILTPVLILVLELICIGLAVGLIVTLKRWDDELYY